MFWILHHTFFNMQYGRRIAQHISGCWHTYLLFWLAFLKRNFRIRGIELATIRSVVPQLPLCSIVKLFMVLDGFFSPSWLYDPSSWLYDVYKLFYVSFYWSSFCDFEYFFENRVLSCSLESMLDVECKKAKFQCWSISCITILQFCCRVLILSNIFFLPCRYTLFWILVLLSKFLFSYYFEVSINVTLPQDENTFLWFLMFLVRSLELYPSYTVAHICLAVCTSVFT